MAWLQSAEGNGDCVRVARPRRCPTLSNPVPWQNWMVAYLGYTLWLKTLFCGWPIMVHDTHMKRTRRSLFCMPLLGWSTPNESTSTQRHCSWNCTALVVCTWAHSVKHAWYCSAILCWPAAAGGSLGVTQKATILGLGQTGCPQNTTDYRSDRAFCVAESRVWNSLSSSTQNASSLPIFRWLLKCELFCLCCGSHLCWYTALITNPTTVSWTH